MACLERASPVLKEILLRIHRTDRPMELEMDHHWHEFGSIHYHVQHSASDPHYIYLSISMPNLSQGLHSTIELPEHSLAMVKKICPGVMETIEPPNDGFQLTVKLNFLRMPSSIKASTKIITGISSVQAVLLCSQLKEIIMNVDAKPLKFVYHGRELFFVVKQPDKITAVLPMNLENEVVAMAFFQELMETRNSKAYHKAPHCTWSPIPPPELRGESIEDLTNNSGFISFGIMPWHTQEKKLDRIIWSILNFQTFVKYHVKTTKGFIQRRMRTCLDKMVQRLQHTGLEEDQSTNKKAHVKQGTKPKKWIVASKSKLLKRKHNVTRKIRRTATKIKIHVLSCFRRGLAAAGHSPMTKYVKLE